MSICPFVRMLKYAPTATTASVTPPRRASVVRAQRNRERRGAPATGASET